MLFFKIKTNTTVSETHNLAMPKVTDLTLANQNGRKHSVTKHDTSVLSTTIIHRLTKKNNEVCHMSRKFWIIFQSHSRTTEKTAYEICVYDQNQDRTNSCCCLPLQNKPLPTRVLFSSELMRKPFLRYTYK